MPSVFSVGGVHESVALPFVACATMIENAGSDTRLVPSLTEMMMLENVPAFADVGVPESRPVDVLNVAHDGAFWMLNVSVSPFGSEAVGWKLYVAPTLAVVAGVPLMRGALALAVIVNAGSEAVRLPSLTLIMMFVNVPAAVGVPLKRPVAVSNTAQAGQF